MLVPACHARARLPAGAHVLALLRIRTRKGRVDVELVPARIRRSCEMRCFLNLDADDSSRKEGSGADEIRRSALVPKALGEDIFAAGLKSVTRDHPYMKIPAQAKLGRAPSGA